MRWRGALAALLLAGSASMAAADGCSPPGGLNPQQWFYICGPALQQAYAMGMGQGLPWEAFVQAMYQVYMQPPPMMANPYQGGGGAMQGGGGGVMMCQLGETQCFSGYLRTCQQMATGGTWWITGSQQCQ